MLTKGQDQGSAEPRLSWRRRGVGAGRPKWDRAFDDLKLAADAARLGAAGSRLLSRDPGHGRRKRERRAAGDLDRRRARSTCRADHPTRNACCRHRTNRVVDGFATTANATGGDERGAEAIRRGCRRQLTARSGARRKHQRGVELTLAQKWTSSTDLAGADPRRRPICRCRCSTAQIMNYSVGQGVQAAFRFLTDASQVAAQMRASARRIDTSSFPEREIDGGEERFPSARISIAAAAMRSSGPMSTRPNRRLTFHAAGREPRRERSCRNGTGPHGGRGGGGLAPLDFMRPHDEPPSAAPPSFLSPTRGRGVRRRSWLVRVASERARTSRRCRGEDGGDGDRGPTRTDAPPRSRDPRRCTGQGARGLDRGSVEMVGTQAEAAGVGAGGDRSREPVGDRGAWI